MKFLKPFLPILFFADPAVAATTDAGAGAGATGGGGAGSPAPSSPAAPAAAPAGAPPAESPNVRQLREQYESTKKAYEPYEKLGLKPEQIQQFQGTYQQVFEEVQSLGETLGIDNSEIEEAAEKFGWVKVLDALRTESWERDQADSGNEDVRRQRELDERIQQGIDQHLGPIKQQQNVRQTNEANHLFERTVQNLFGQELKSLGIDPASVEPDERELLVSAASEMMKYDEAGLRALKYQGKTDGIVKAFGEAKTMLDKYFLARFNREAKMQQAKRPGGRPAAGGNGNGDAKKISLDDMINDPGVIDPKYA